MIYWWENIHKVTNIYHVRKMGHICCHINSSQHCIHEQVANIQQQHCPTHLHRHGYSLYHSNQFVTFGKWKSLWPRNTTT